MSESLFVSESDQADQLWSQGKQVEGLYNLKARLQKLSPSTRRDELLRQVEDMLNVPTPLVLMDRKEYMEYLGQSYSVERCKDLFVLLEQCQSRRKEDHADMEELRFERARALEQYQSATVSKSREQYSIPSTALGWASIIGLILATCIMMLCLYIQTK
jgi:hypothetical protein